MPGAACPQCGAALTFRSVGLPVIVCAFCRSTVLRSGEDLTRLGESASLPETATPLQLGSSGRDGSQAFTLIGSVRWLWGAAPDNNHVAQGVWTEWLMLFDDGGHGWLAEAGGRLMLTRRSRADDRNALVAALRQGGAIKPGTRAQFGKIGYRVIDARPAVSAGCDGELPFAAPPGETMFGVDLAGADGSFASVQRHKDSIEVYLGRYVRLRELAPRGLRAVPGWAAPGWAASGRAA